MVRNLRVALIAGLLLSPLALGGWRGIPGISGQAPQDVWIWDAGVFSVNGWTTAYKLEDVPDGSVGVVPPTLSNLNNWAGTYLDDAGCLVGVTRTGVFTDCAGRTVTLVVNSTDDFSTFRATSGYAAYADGNIQGTTPGQFYAPAGSLLDAGSMKALSGPFVHSPWISVLRVGSDDFALLGLPFTTHLVENGTALPGFPAFNLPALGSDLWVARDGGLRGVLTRVDAGGLYVVSDGSGSTATPFVVGAATSVVRSIAYREGEGNQYGDGWGMALVDDTVVYSAIPDPAAPARTWVPSTNQPPTPGSGTWNVIRCLGAGYCVLASNNSTTGLNLVSYRNAAQPMFQAALGFTVDEGSSPDLVVDAGDPDGDAVFVTWSFDAGYTSLFTLGASSPDGKRLRIDAPGGRPALCGVPSLTVAVEVFLSDGVASHVTSDAGTVTVVHTSAPPAPLGATISVPAGAGVQAVSLTQPAGVCPVRQDYALQAPQQLATSVTPLGLGSGPRTFTPPATLCSPAPVSDTYVVRAFDEQLFSPPAVLTMEVTPWGEPLPPFAGPRSAAQDAGGTARYFPEQTHACASVSPSFPGVTTRWSWDSGVPFATVVSTGDGGVQVSTLECTAGTIALSATNQTNDDAGLVSPPGQLTVDVFTVLQSIDGLPVLLDAGVSGAGSGVVGVADVDVNCKSLRTLSADLALLRLDGGAVSSIAGGPLGPFALSAPGECNGGDFAVEAVVRQEDGGASAVTRSGLISLPFRPAEVAAIDAQDFKVACGGPATTVATAAFGDGGCDSAGLEWSGSAPYPILPASGRQAALETVSQDFGDLIGRLVEVTATSDAGPGNGGGLQALLRVVADPFVVVSHRVETPVAVEPRPFTVEVTLTNTSACAVGEVELRETLDGMSWLPGTVRMGGVELADARLEPGDAGLAELVVPGVLLAGGASLTISYSARPVSLGSPSPRGRAELRQVPISEPSGLTAGASTCGCGAGGLGGPALLGLGALARALRRRHPSRK